MKCYAFRLPVDKKETRSCGDSLRKALLTRIAGAHIQDLISRLHILGDNILEAGVALVPIELLLVLLVTVLPVILFSVLGHFLLLLITIRLTANLNGSE